MPKFSVRGFSIRPVSGGGCWQKKEKAPLGRPFRVSEANALFSLVAKRVFHVAYGVVCFAFRFVELAFSLQLLVAGHLAGRVLNRALCFVGGTLDVFAIHDRLHCYLLFTYTTLPRRRCSAMRGGDAFHHRPCLDCRRY